jgi:predicted Rossmann-fold nucleotide-binding protein
MKTSDAPLAGRVTRRSLLRAGAAACAGAIGWPLFSDASGVGHAACPPISVPGQLDELLTLDEVRKAGANLEKTAIKGLDLSEFPASYWKEAHIETTFFLGCRFRDRKTEDLLLDRGAIVFPRFEGLAYDPYRRNLYSVPELMEKLPPAGVRRDLVIYEEYLRKGRLAPNIIEALARRIHDDSMDDALERLLRQIDPFSVVGIMGGSAVARSDPWYRTIAETARLLTLDGRIVVTGGGPGAMEAAGLGAYLSSYDTHALDTALRILAQVPTYSGNVEPWIETGLKVRAQYPKGGDNLSMPTWFYGSQPTNVFATWIAKYFDNSIREGQIVQTPKAGIVFAPGSAGTRQEIFMDAVLDQYSTTGVITPMVFLGKRQYQIDAPIFEVLQRTANGKYKDRLFITDEPSKVVAFLRSHTSTGCPDA